MVDCFYSFLLALSQFSFKASQLKMCCSHILIKECVYNMASGMSTPFSILAHHLFFCIVKNLQDTVIKPLVSRQNNLNQLIILSINH